MTEPTEPTSQGLLRELGKVSRGLTVLFWAFPALMVILVKTTTKLRTELEPFDFFPPLVVAILLVYGLNQLSDFRKGERIWQVAIDRARIFAYLILGLSPFLYCWVRVPDQPFFFYCVLILFVSAIVLMGLINLVLQRLAAMLPDQTLRQEVKVFSTFNIYLLAFVPLLLLFYRTLSLMQEIPLWLENILNTVPLFNPWTFLFFLVLPLATTMALIWKAREAVLHGIFGKG
jgi:hypothetical protein